MAGQTPPPDFRRFFEAAPGPYLVVAAQPSFTVIAANKAYLELTRARREALIGRSVFDLVPANDDGHAQAGAGQTLRRSFERVSQQGVTDVIPLQRFDLPDEQGELRERYWRSVNVPVRGSSGAVEAILHGLEEVTDAVTLARSGELRDRSNAELRERALRLEYEMAQNIRQLQQEQQGRTAVESAIEGLRAERALREKFVATLTHDLRNPMAAARVSAQLVLRSLGKPDEVAVYASRIVVNIDRADQMIQDLLDANRIRAGEKLPLRLNECDLSSVLRDVVASLTTVHGERFILNAPEHAPGRCDASAIRRVTENLVSNAIKYGDEQKPVTITLVVHPTEFELRVHNEGQPIDDAEKEALFLPWIRTSRADGGPQRGWGLGLTLVHGVVDAHGGRVKVESAEQVGTVFTVFLPRS